MSASAHSSASVTGEASFLCRTSKSVAYTSRITPPARSAISVAAFIRRWQKVSAGKTKGLNLFEHHTIVNAR